MATLLFDTTDRININPLSTSLNNIPNGACTIAVLLTRNSNAAQNWVFGLRGGDLSGDFYHGLGLNGSTIYTDDDGIVGVDWATGPSHPLGDAAGDFFIMVLDWGTGTATERLHVSAGLGSAESWTHQNSDGNNGGLQAGPGTGSGFFHIGNYEGNSWVGQMALFAVWAGTRFSDADVEALWVNKNTSDWYNHSAGTPDTLIELTSTSPTDIGGDPVSSISVSGAAATGNNPSGWTFDGAGAGQAQPTLDPLTKRILFSGSPTRFRG